MNINLLHPIIISFAIPVALYFFGLTIRRQYMLMKACAPTPDPITDHGTRIKEVLTVYFGQKKLFQEQPAGLMHAIIFWGFCILAVRAVTMFGMAFAGFDFSLPFLGSEWITGKIYSLSKDVANVGVTIMVIYAFYRRYIARVPRLKNSSGAAFVLAMIFALMISDMIFDSVYHAASGKGFEIWAPVGSIFGGLFFSNPSSPGNGAILFAHFCFLFHCLGILGFLVYLPHGKHLHVVSAVFNVYLHPLNREGRMTKLDLEDEDIESFGVTKPEENTWKDTLDLYTCTECGRCNDACPANRTEKKLAPREITYAQNHFLQDDEAERILAGDQDAEPSKEMVPDVVSPEEIWACTNCYACEQACPVNISYVQRINSLRRSEVLNKSEFPSELKRTFKGMETNNNPWGIGSSTRMDWAKDLDLPMYEEHQDAEYLLFFGCAASFDDRAIKISRTLVDFLKKHKISFAVLGTDEPCCGETARRLGEEALGQMLIETNVELFNELKVKKILTPCPHCFNTFKNEYPDFDGKFEVLHHSQLIADMVRSGAISPESESRKTIVLHDSCYLGRVNRMYDPPRTILKSISGVNAVECKENSGPNGFCCGAGGGMFWIEEEGHRINDERLNQLMRVKPDEIATACPYCLVMLNEAVKDAGLENVCVKDVIEMIHPLED